MALLLSIFLLFYQAGSPPATDALAIDFSAVKQGKAGDQGCIPLFSRQISFRIRNRSDKTIFIHGLKTEAGFYPLGSLFRHIEAGGQWLDPVYKSAPRRFKEVGFPAHDVYLLKPGKSMKFNNLAEDAYIGGRLKRVIYISLSRDEEPQMIASEEFFLR